MLFRRASIRYGRTPEPETPYQKAAQAWDERIGSARAQAKNWRLIAFANLALATGLVIGFVSLAVGFIVGKAMNFGSRGVGGRRYQIAAALLTYIAVSMSAVPIAIHQMRAHRAQTQPSATTAPARAPVRPALSMDSCWKPRVTRS